MCEYRVFVSYARDDRAAADQICGVLSRNGVLPVWDQSFASGHGFHDQIKNFIQHAHIFMPLITKKSSNRGWVHQEIGYALALNIPVLPVCYQPATSQQRATGETRVAGTRTPGPAVPGQFLHELQAIQLTDPIEQHEAFFRHRIFTNLVSRYEDPALARYSCSDQREERAITMAKFANDAYLAQQALGLQPTGHVRQRGALSSFHIPDRVITDAAWRDRYEQRLDHAPHGVAASDPATIEKRVWNRFIEHGGPTPFHRKVQRMERIALTKHAQIAGFSIIINPHMEFSSITHKARLVRLRSLVEFLEAADGYEEPMVVAINPEMRDQVNTTIVGDWFAAESVTMVGSRQTNFTTHAPSIQTRIELFDTELMGLLQQRGWTCENSRQHALVEIRGIMSNLQNDQTITQPDAASCTETRPAD